MSNDDGNRTFLQERADVIDRHLHESQRTIIHILDHCVATNVGLTQWVEVLNKVSESRYLVRLHLHAEDRKARPL